MRQSAMRAEKIEKLRGLVLSAQLAAARHVARVVRGEHPDSHVPWKEVSGQTRAALIMQQGSMAAQRAETMAEAPKQLGVIVVAGRLADTPQNRLSWEESAAKLNSDRAIEAVAVPKEPNGNP